MGCGAKRNNHALFEGKRPDGSSRPVPWVAHSLSGQFLQDSFGRKFLKLRPSLFR